MTYLLHILAALLMLGLAGDPRTETQRLWVLPLLLVVPHVIARIAALLLVRGRFRLGALAERLLVITPIALQAIAVALAGWGATVTSWTGRSMGLDGWPGPALALALAPFFVFQLLTIDARARLHASAGAALQRVRAFQLRLFWSACVPFGCLLGAMSVVGASEVLRVHVEEIAFLNLLFAAGLAVLFVAALPGLLRRTWSTAPLAPSPLRDHLERIAERAGFRCRELLVWNTGHQMANAAVVGFTPRTRLVLFSDALLAQLDSREITGVFAHEIGHTRRHHAKIFSAFGLLFLVTADLVLGWLEIQDPLAIGAAFAVLLGAGYVVFGYLSRRFELEADLEGAEVMGDTGPLVDALHAVTGVHAHERASWRHFSTRQRVEFLERVERDPSQADRLRRKLRLATRSAILLLVVALALEVFFLFGSLGVERTFAQLRLGRYEAAAARVAAGAEVDDDLRALVERGVRVPVASRDAGALEEAALERLLADDASGALELLDLARLRGAMGLRSVRARLRTLVSPQAEFSVGADPLPEAWRAAFERRARAQ